MHLSSAILAAFILLAVQKGHASGKNVTKQKEEDEILKNILFPFQKNGAPPTRRNLRKEAEALDLITQLVSPETLSPLTKDLEKRENLFKKHKNKRRLKKNKRKKVTSSSTTSSLSTTAKKELTTTTSTTTETPTTTPIKKHRNVKKGKKQKAKKSNSKKIKSSITEEPTTTTTTTTSTTTNKPLTTTKKLKSKRKKAKQLDKKKNKSRKIIITTKSSIDSTTVTPNRTLKRDVETTPATLTDEQKKRYMNELVKLETEIADIEGVIKSDMQQLKRIIRNPTNETKEMEENDSPEYRHKLLAILDMLFKKEQNDALTMNTKQLFGLLKTKVAKVSKLKKKIACINGNTNECDNETMTTLTENEVNEIKPVLNEVVRQVFEEMLNKTKTTSAIEESKSSGKKTRLFSNGTTTEDQEVGSTTPVTSHMHKKKKTRIFGSPSHQTQSLEGSEDTTKTTSFTTTPKTTKDIFPEIQEDIKLNLTTPKSSTVEGETTATPDMETTKKSRIGISLEADGLKTDATTSNSETTESGVLSSTEAHKKHKKTKMFTTTGEEELISSGKTEETLTEGTSTLSSKLSSTDVEEERGVTVTEPFTTKSHKKSRNISTTNLPEEGTTLTTEKAPKSHKKLKHLTTEATIEESTPGSYKKMKQLTTTEVEPATETSSSIADSHEKLKNFTTMAEDLQLLTTVAHKPRKHHKKHKTTQNENGELVTGSDEGHTVLPITETSEELDLEQVTETETTTEAKTTTAAKIKKVKKTRIFGFPAMETETLTETSKETNTEASTEANKEASTEASLLSSSLDYDNRTIKQKWSSVFHHKKKGKSLEATTPLTLTTETSTSSNSEDAVNTSGDSTTEIVKKHKKIRILTTEAPEYNSSNTNIDNKKTFETFYILPRFYEIEINSKKYLHFQNKTPPAVVNVMKPFPNDELVSLKKKKKKLKDKDLDKKRQKRGKKVSSETAISTVESSETTTKETEASKSTELTTMSTSVTKEIKKGNKPRRLKDSTESPVGTTIATQETSMTGMPRHLIESTETSSATTAETKVTKDGKARHLTKGTELPTTITPETTEVGKSKSLDTSFTEATTEGKRKHLKHAIKKVKTGDDESMKGTSTEKQVESTKKHKLKYEHSSTTEVSSKVKDRKFHKSSINSSSSTTQAPKDSAEEERNLIATTKGEDSTEDPRNITLDTYSIKTFEPEEESKKTTLKKLGKLATVETPTTEPLVHSTTETTLITQNETNTENETLTTSVEELREMKVSSTKPEHDEENPTTVSSELLNTSSTVPITYSDKINHTTEPAKETKKSRKTPSNPPLVDKVLLKLNSTDLKTEEFNYTTSSTTQIPKVEKPKNGTNDRKLPEENEAKNQTYVKESLETNDTNKINDTVENKTEKHNNKKTREVKKVDEPNVENNATDSNVTAIDTQLNDRNVTTSDHKPDELSVTITEHYANETNITNGRLTKDLLPHKRNATGTGNDTDSNSNATTDAVAEYVRKGTTVFSTNSTEESTVLPSKSTSDEEERKLNVSSIIKNVISTTRASNEEIETTTSWSATTDAIGTVITTDTVTTTDPVTTESTTNS